MKPLEASFPVVPRQRVDLIDVRRLAADTYGDTFERYPRCTYCSWHTTAGYLPQGLSARLHARSQTVGSYIDFLRTVFPEGAGYRHDQLDLREDLTPAQRRVEPLNGDSHLAFIAGGLRACVSYRTGRREPVYLVDLDGVNQGHPRRRTTTIVGWNDEVEVTRITFPVPVSSHPIDAVNLKDPSLGLFGQLGDLLAKYDVMKGRVRLRLKSTEQGASLTVNEYETLLMRHDLGEVLQSPLRFAAQKARHMWNDPAAVPHKALDYAKYDLIRAANRFVDAVGLGSSRIEHLISRVVAIPAARFLSTRRSVDLLVSDAETAGQPRIVSGTYQAPVLLQWQGAARQTRVIEMTLSRFV
jgi:thiamine phosphate synthase YjbQ (UPF0047 family)